MKSAGMWKCEDCDKDVQSDYEQIAYSGIPICPECGEEMEFDQEVFLNIVLVTPIRIVIILEGGMIQTIYHNQSKDTDVDVIILDADCEGADDDEITKINGDDWIMSSFETFTDKEFVEKVNSLY
mgnify:CR=1 FL=1